MCCVDLHDVMCVALVGPTHLYRGHYHSSSLSCTQVGEEVLPSMCCVDLHDVMCVALVGPTHLYRGHYHSSSLSCTQVGEEVLPSMCCVDLRMTGRKASSKVLPSMCCVELRMTGWKTSSICGLPLLGHTSRVGQNHICTVCIRYFWRGIHHTYGIRSCTVYIYGSGQLCTSGNLAVGFNVFRFSCWVVLFFSVNERPNTTLEREQRFGSHQSPTSHMKTETNL